MQLKSFCLDVANHGLVLSSSGNASCCENLVYPAVKENQFMYITASGYWLKNVSNFSFCRVNLNDGSYDEDSVRPSSESKIHRQIYNTRKDAKVILHCQSQYATSLACYDLKLPSYNVIPEIPYYCGQIKKVPYTNPGDVGQIIDAFSDNRCNIVQVKNHGQFIIGDSFSIVLKRAVFFEFACKIILTCPDIKLLSFINEDDIKQLIKL